MIPKGDIQYSANDFLPEMKSICVCPPEWIKAQQDLQLKNLFLNYFHNINCKKFNIDKRIIL